MAYTVLEICGKKVKEANDKEINEVCDLLVNLLCECTDEKVK